MGDEALGFEVVVEGNGFYVFLDTAADVALVAPGIETLQIRDDGGKEVVDLLLS